MTKRFNFPPEFFKTRFTDENGMLTPEMAAILSTSLTADNLPDGGSYQRTASNNMLAPAAPFNGDNEQWADTDFLPLGWQGAYISGSSAVGRNNYRRATSTDAFRGNYAQLLMCGSNLTDRASRATRPEDVKEFLQYEFNGRAKITKRPSSGNHGYRIEVDWFSDDASLARNGTGWLSTTTIQSGAATPFAADNVYQAFNATVTAPSGAKFARIVEANDATLRSVSEQALIYSDTWTWKVKTLNVLNAVVGVNIGSYALLAFAQIPDMTLTLTTRGEKILITFCGSIQCDNVGNNQGWFSLFRDGLALTNVPVVVDTFAVANSPQIVTMLGLDAPPAGSHTYTAQWHSNAGQTLSIPGAASGTPPCLEVLQLP